MQKVTFELEKMPEGRTKRCLKLAEKSRTAEQMTEIDFESLTE